MSADFWAGYGSGAVGILVGNPLDIVKTRLQAGSDQPRTNNPQNSSADSRISSARFGRWSSFARGAAAPVVGYGALNALLFVTYNRSLALLDTGSIYGSPEKASAWSIWAAGALGGLATFLVSAPTELVKCRAQVCLPPRSSMDVSRDIWRTSGLRGFYMGGGITSVRDAVGYGFYFWSYQLSKDFLGDESDNPKQQALKALVCGGIAGVVTWASIFPLDVIKTRVQTWDVLTSPSRSSSAISATQPLLAVVSSRPSSLSIARSAYDREGLAVFFRGLGVCSVRAFFVNAVQWAVYEWMMKVLTEQVGTASQASTMRVSGQHDGDNIPA